MKRIAQRCCLIGLVVATVGGVGAGVSTHPNPLEVRFVQQDEPCRRTSDLAISISTGEQMVCGDKNPGPEHASGDAGRSAGENFSYDELGEVLTLARRLAADNGLSTTDMSEITATVRRLDEAHEAPPNPVLMTGFFVGLLVLVTGFVIGCRSGWIRFERAPRPEERS